MRMQVSDTVHSYFVHTFSVCYVQLRIKILFEVDGTIA